VAWSPLEVPTSYCNGKTELWRWHSQVIAPPVLSFTTHIQNITHSSAIIWSISYTLAKLTLHEHRDCVW
jgi:hypothetical protein